MKTFWISWLQALNLPTVQGKVLGFFHLVKQGSREWLMQYMRKKIRTFYRVVYLVLHYGYARKAKITAQESSEVNS